MLFNSLPYLIFLPALLLVYYTCPKPWRWLVIFTGSCFFYMQFVPKYILILFFIILIDYATARLMDRSTGFYKKFWFLLSLVSNILLLCVFKYADFILQNFFDVVHWIGWNTNATPSFNLLLPIGLSFHTFQSMSYTIEVYQGRQKAETHLGYFANYVLFFPQMVAGPIERYSRLGEALKYPKLLNYESIRSSLWLICFGLFIKMCIADNLAPCVDALYAKEHLSMLEAWSAVGFFSIQIYADFFGYSTIAIGSARLLGVSIMDNFKSPYRAASLTEFWSRWHISLSTWFRDYLYIPLGGNKNSKTGWILSILLVFSLSGLWHGASWTFLVWGLLHGLARIFEGRTTSNNYSFTRMLTTFLTVSLFWVFFRASSFNKASSILVSCFSFQNNLNSNIALNKAFLWALLMIPVEWFLNQQRFDQRMQEQPKWLQWGIMLSILYALTAYGGTQALPFIYFQF